MMFYDLMLATKKTLLIAAILTSLLCSLSGGLPAPWDRGDAQSLVSAQKPRTDALVNLQNARADGHLAKPKFARHFVSHGVVPPGSSLLSASASRFLQAQSQAARYFSQFPTQPTGRAPPTNFN